MKTLSNQKERVKLILTDGVSIVTGMLAAQMKDLYDNGTLRLYALVNIKDFITNIIGQQKLVSSLSLISPETWWSIVTLIDKHQFTASWLPRIFYVIVWNIGCRRITKASVTLRPICDEHHIVILFLLTPSIVIDIWCLQIYLIYYIETDTNTLITKIV